MRKLRSIFVFLLALGMCASFSGCAAQQTSNIVATTLPVYELTAILCEGTELTVSRLITEELSCLHDYTLQVSQMRMVEAADVIVISGVGLESFLDDVLDSADQQIDASEGISLLCIESDHGHDHGHGHDHEHDPHIWLDPANGMRMAQNICQRLCEIYPVHTEHFKTNLAALETEFNKLSAYAAEQLFDLSCRELVTFHDGFAYLAHAYDLSILRAIEEESGSEASAAELIELIELVKKHNLTTVFTECSGSTSAAQIISAETGVAVCELDMAIAGNSYFDAMYHNIDTLKEALG